MRNFIKFGVQVGVTPPNTFSIANVGGNLEVITNTMVGDYFVYDWRKDNVSLAVANIPMKEASNIGRNFSSYALTTTNVGSLNLSGAGRAGFGTPNNFSSTDHIKIASHPQLEATQDISISVHMKPVAYITQYGGLVTKRNINASLNWQIYRRYNDYIAFGRQGNVSVVNTATALTLGSYSHVALKRTGDVYVIDEGTNTASATDPYALTTGDDVYIGVVGADDLISPFEGELDEVLIYNRSISAGQQAFLSAGTYDKLHANEITAGSNWTCLVTGFSAGVQASAATSNVVAT